MPTPLCSCCFDHVRSAGHDLCERCLETPVVRCGRDLAEDCDRNGFVPAICTDGEWVRECEDDLCYYCENYPRSRSRVDPKFEYVRLFGAAIR